MDYSVMTYLKLDAWDGSGKWYADEELNTPPSDGSFEIRASLINVPGGGTSEDAKRIRKTEACQKALEYQVLNQQEIFRKIMEAARKEYDRAVANKDTYNPETVDLYLPEVHNQDEFKALITPLGIHVGYTDENGVEYVGYGFDCSWDEEHGFGVRFIKLEVQDFGYEEVTF